MRLDTWLWAARIYKTRKLAAKSIEINRVTRNGSKTKAAAMINEGDRLSVKRGYEEWLIVVDKLLDKRGSAKIAQTMYHETQNSINQRERQKELRAMQPQVSIDHKKPSKKTIRENRAFKRGEVD